MAFGNFFASTVQFVSCVSKHRDEFMETSNDWALNDYFHHLSKEARELYLPEEVACISSTPSPLSFHRDWVSPNKPVIIKGCVDHWPAVTRWTPTYLRQKIGECPVTVAVTPNGLADAVQDGAFVMPEERRMPFSSFLDILASKEDTGVYYIQKQNSNLLSEFSDLIGDVDTELPWASEALGKKPDAVNFWMGEEKAVTSMHKDHYENLYCVISGEKEFILHPPTDLPYIPYGMYPAAYYRLSTDGAETGGCASFDVITDPDLDPVPWIPIDPVKPDLTKYPEYAKSRPIRCTVKAGDVLYLPSLWFHHVRQSQATIAVNFWYDMEYDIKYNYFKFLEGLVKCNKSSGIT